MQEPLRVFAASGPGDIVGARKAVVDGQRPNTTSIAYSEQLLAYCRTRKMIVLAISSNGRRDEFRDCMTTLENRAKPLSAYRGIGYHISQLVYGCYLAVRARRFRADVAIIDSGTTHYFVLVLFAAFRIPVIINLHNVLWPPGFPPTSIPSRIIAFLDRLFFSFVATGAIGVSPECGRQIAFKSAGKLPFAEYRCQFSGGGFRQSQPYASGTFRITFAGRAETNKGTLDLGTIAALLRDAGKNDFVFEVCGEGSAISELLTTVERDQTSTHFVFHGRLERDELLKVYSRSHLVIVPTRSNFTEGMPQVCAEAVLSGLPVIASSVSNAFDVIEGAVLIAEADKPEAYAEHICRVMDCPTLRERLRMGCERVRSQFLDRKRSLPAALDGILEIALGKTRLEEYDSIFLELD